MNTNRHPVIAIDYEKVAVENFDFWLRFCHNAKRFGYEAFIVCGNPVSKVHEDLMLQLGTDYGISASVFVTHTDERSSRLFMMRRFGCEPDIWIESANGRPVLVPQPDPIDCY